MLAILSILIFMRTLCYAQPSLELFLLFAKKFARAFADPFLVAYKFATIKIQCYKLHKRWYKLYRQVSGENQYIRCQYFQELTDNLFRKANFLTSII